MSSLKSKARFPEVGISSPRTEARFSGLKCFPSKPGRVFPGAECILPDLRLTGGDDDKPDL